MTHASLFSGIGGCEVAAAMMGWENAFHCEINPFGRAVLDYWFPKSKSYEDITKTNFEQWRGKVDILTGGFPCQPFSHAGLRRGANDDRYLWPHMLRAIQEIRPTWVIGENVIGITTMVEPMETIEVGSQTSLFGETDDLRTYETRSRFTIERVCADLESLGYEVQPLAIPAAAAGAPHQRFRVFIIGRLAQDSMRVGLQGESAERRHSAQFGNSRTTSGDGQTGLSDRPGEVVYGGGQNDNYTNRERWYEEQLHTRFADESQQTQCGEFQHGGAARSYMFSRWRNFPTVSPIHRGDDGLPFPMDGLTIPFNKWRQEALKAYGNAIVPQVVYEIFRAIEEVEQSKSKQS